MNNNIPRYHITEQDSMKLSAMCFLRSSKGGSTENPYRVGDVVAVTNASGVGTVCAGLGEYILVALLRFDNATKAYAHTGETVVKKVTEVKPFELHGSREELLQHGIASLLRSTRHV